jgi:hypothetical protein
MTVSVIVILVGLTTTTSPPTFDELVMLTVAVDSPGNGGVINLDTRTLVPSALILT